MSRPSARRLQAGGRRYLARRLEREVAGGDTRPARVALVCGAAAAVLVLVAVAVLAWIRPAAGLGDDAIVMVRGTGALYVRIGATAHPVANLTSAQLIAGAADTPRVVDEAALRAVKRGPLLGIPGAPAALGPPLDAAQAGWTVCDAPGDDTTLTTVIAGSGPPGAHIADPILVESASGTRYLLYDGRRAAVDTTDPAILRTLRIESVTPRPVSAALLGLIPEAAPLAVPRIAGAGNPGPGALRGHAVGDVVRVRRAAGPELYVVLGGGVQAVGRLAADVIRFASADRESGIAEVAPDELDGIPTVGTLPVSGFPDRPAARPVPPVLCAGWADGRVTIEPSEAAPPALSGATALAQADGPGPAVDAVSVPPGRSVYARTGAADWVITDTGVRLGIGDDAAARALGLPEHPAAAPWPLLSLLPTGPELSREAALVARDVVAPR